MWPDSGLSLLQGGATLKQKGRAEGTMTEVQPVFVEYDSTYEELQKIIVDQVTEYEISKILQVTRGGSCL